jgi:hypothetical protein
MNSAARLILLVLCVCTVFSFGSSDAPKTHMTKEQAISVGIQAIEARFPGATKNWSFDATFRDGVWGVAGVIPNRPPGLLGGGMPTAEIRDSDRVVLGVYFAR